MRHWSVVAPPTCPKAVIRKHDPCTSKMRTALQRRRTSTPLNQPRTMPPKVYGKKKGAARTTTSFSKFTSPEKNDSEVQERGVKKSADGIEENDWRQQLEDAAETSPKDDALAALEKDLGGLSLEQIQPIEPAEKKKKGRPRKAANDGVSIKTKENHSQNDVPKDSTAVVNGDGEPKASQLQLPVQVKKPKRRVALEKCDPDDRTINRQIVEACDVKEVKGQAEATALSSPVRKKGSISRKHSGASPSRKPQLPTPEPTPEPDDVHVVYASPLLSLSYGKKIVTFESWSSELEPHFEITKIAEASFSEVYRLSALNATGISSQESVLKIVALKTPPDAPLPCQLQTRSVRDREGQVEKEMAERYENDVWKSEVADVLSEVKLLQNLNHIPGFTNFRDLTILQGRPSSAFSNAWKTWNKSRPRGKKSEFPDPSKKTSYDDTQLWAIVEMQDAGSDCEKLMEQGGLSSIWEVWDVFWGVSLSVAKAEEACRFEHRDLHMGNICVRPSRAGGDITNITVEDPMRRKFRFTGIETTVIDYTLSRADILSSTSRRSSSTSVRTVTSSSSHPDITEQDVAWLDLNKDSALFEGDASEEYQYEIYRYMYGAALFNNPLQQEPSELPEAPVEPVTPRRSPRKNTHIRFDETDAPVASPTKESLPCTADEMEENVWRDFHPKTNLVWAHFLLHKLLAHLEKCTSKPTQLSIEQIMANVETTDEPAKVKKKALKLYSVLKKVSELLCPMALSREESLGSVKELVVLALEQRWLRVDDVAA
jgi:serine/threonine-protein kinase haspin